jgi:hypothetical protein
MAHHDLAVVSVHDESLAASPLDRAVAAYLTRFTGSSRDHARSDLHCFLGLVAAAQWPRCPACG